MPPWREDRADVADEAGDDRVPGRPAVAVLVQRHLVGTRGDDEGGIAHDEVEAFATHGVEERPGAQVEVDAGELGVERRVAEGPLRDVGGDDLLGVRGQVQRLDSAPCPEVERAGDGGAGRPAGERRRRAADAEDVVGRQRRPEDELAVVRGDVPGPLLVAVGPHLGGRAHPVRGQLCQPELHEARGRQRRQQLVDLSRVDGLAEREEPDEGRQRTVDLAHATACRDWVLTMEGCGGDRPEEVLHRLYRHPSSVEVTAQGGDESTGCPLRREGGASTGRCCGAIGHGRSAYGTGRPSLTGRATPPAGPRCRTR